ADAPRSARSHLELANVLADQGQYDAAVAELETSLGIFETWSAAYNLGNVLDHAGRRPDAVPAYQRALALKEDGVEAMNNLGHRYDELGDGERAEAWFGKALAVNPDYVPARVNLANSLLRRGAPRDAEPHYRTAIAVEPTNAVAHTNYGVCLEDLGRP